MVTNEAIMRTKMGIRNSFLILSRIKETVTFEPTMTSVVAIPNPKALMKVEETASKGHRPSN
jgi:hypothetical protein